MPEDFRIIGSGRHAPDGDFADEVREALERRRRRLSDADWDALRASGCRSSASSADDGARAGRGGRAPRARSSARTSRTLLYMSVPPSAMQPMVGMLAATGLSTDRARIVHGEAVRLTTWQSATELNAALHEHFAGGRDLPHRPLPRQGGGPGHPRAALRQRPVRADVEPRARRGGADRHPREARPRGPRRRSTRRRARSATWSSRTSARSSASSRWSSPASLDAGALRDAKAAVFRRPAAVRPGRRRCSGSSRATATRTASTGDRRTETFVALRAEIDNDRWRGVPFLLRTGKALAEGRRVVTRHAPRAGLHDLRLPRRRRPPVGRRSCSSSPTTRSSRVERAGQGARAGARWSTRAPLTLDVERALERARPGGVRAPAARRHARRPPAVHPRRRGRAAVGGRRAAARATRRSRSPTRRAAGGRRRPPSSPSRRRLAAAREPLGRPRRPPGVRARVLSPCADGTAPSAQRLRRHPARRGSAGGCHGLRAAARARARSTSTVSARTVAPGVRWTAIDREGGPWRVNVLAIDRDGWRRPRGAACCRTGGSPASSGPRPMGRRQPARWRG